MYHTDATNSLDYLAIDFRADWPLEIIFDKQSLVNYNAVFRFLMRIKRVNYMIQQQDYWVRMRPPRNIANLDL